VTSVDGGMVKSNFANFGYWVGISAPGENIRSTYLGDSYAIWSGTSMATPFVSGQAALIRADDNSLDPEDIEVRIRSEANRSIYDRSTHDWEYLLTYSGKLGAGHADVCASISYP
jgi:subtilisin family serine protease